MMIKKRTTHYLFENWILYLQKAKKPAFCQVVLEKIILIFNFVNDLALFGNHFLRKRVWFFIAQTYILFIPERFEPGWNDIWNIASRGKDFKIRQWIFGISLSSPLERIWPCISSPKDILRFWREEKFKILSLSFRLCYSPPPTKRHGPLYKIIWIFFYPGMFCAKFG